MTGHQKDNVFCRLRCMASVWPGAGAHFCLGYTHIIPIFRLSTLPRKTFAFNDVIIPSPYLEATLEYIDLAVGRAVFLVLVLVSPSTTSAVCTLM